MAVPAPYNHNNNNAVLVFIYFTHARVRQLFTALYEATHTFTNVRQK